MVGPWPLALHHDRLQYIHHVHLMQQGQNRGVTRSGAHTHDQRREAWKTAESCGVTESGSSSTDRPTVTVRVFGLLLG